MTSTATRTVHHLIVTTALSLAAAHCKHEAAEPVVRPAEDAAPIHAVVVEAQARQIPLTLQLTGTLVPDQQSDVTPLVAGRVTEVLVERGTTVHTGDPIMRLRDVDYRTSAAAATAALEQSEARLGLHGGAGTFDPDHVADVRAARANRDLADDGARRAQQLAQTGSVSDQELQRALQQAQAAREQYTAAVNNARAAYFAYQNARVMAEQSRRNVSDSVIRAPFDGEIAERRANVGEFVATSRAVVTLVRTDPLRIELQIPQERIAFVQRGQGVDLHVDAFGDRVFHATVRYISAAVHTDTRSLIAEAVVPNTDAVLRPGMFVTARLDLNRQESVVVIPARAVLTEAGTSRAFVIEGGHVSERVLTVSDRTPTEVLVSQGIRVGERVATEQLERLSDGARVQ